MLRCISRGEYVRVSARMGRASVGVLGWLTRSPPLILPTEM
jgi:hypothetical protein